MDDTGRRRRPNEASISANANSRYQAHDPNGQGRPQPTGYGAGTNAGGSSDSRYRPPPLNTSPSTARAMGGAATYSGYSAYPESNTAFSTAMPQNTMPYQAEYGQDTRQTQNFTAYNTSMMYNVTQTGAQNGVYDSSQPFPSRQPAAMQMMSADVAAPYFPGEPANAASAGGLQTQAVGTSTSAVYQQNPADQRAMLQSYPGAMSGGLGAQTSPPDQILDDQDYALSAEMGEAYDQYQNALKDIFSDIRNGLLATASESVLNVSDWLLTNVTDLGLAGDNSLLYAERIKLWHDFNHAWLALLQRQKEIMQLGQQRPQTVMTEDGLKRMGRELIRLCDGLERHGLVDYEYGVWEELIVEKECLDCYQNTDETAQNAARPAKSVQKAHHVSR